MTVTLSLFAGAGAQFFDNNGVPLTGGLIYTYAAGTTTPAVTYTSYTGFVSHTNPIVLDSAGRVPSGGEIWLLVGQSYKFILKTSANVLIATYDNIPSAPQPPIANDAASISYEQGNTVSAGAFVTGNSYMIATVGSTNFTAVGAINNVVGTVFIATGAGSGTGNAYSSRTVQNKLQETISVMDFGAVGDGITNDTTAIQNAHNSGKSIYYPNGTYLVTSTVTVSNVDFVMFGQNAVLKCGTDSLTPLFSVTNADKVLIEGLTFDANALGKGFVYVTNCPDLQISKNTFHNFKDDPSVAGNFSAVQIALCPNARITNNFFYDLGQNYGGSGIQPSQYRAITQNTSCDKTIVADNVFQSLFGAHYLAEFPVWTSGTSYVVNNRVFIFESNQWNLYRCISNNTASGLNQPPNATFWTLEYSDVEPTQSTCFSNNICRDVKDNSVYFIENIKSMVVSGNTFIAANDESIVVVGQNITITGNSFINTKNKAIALELGEGDINSVTISGNSFIQDDSNFSLGTFIIYRNLSATNKVGTLSITGNNFKSPYSVASASYIQIKQVDNLVISGNVFDLGCVDAEIVIRAFNTVGKGLVSNNVFLTANTNARPYQNESASSDVLIVSNMMNGRILANDTSELVQLGYIQDTGSNIYIREPISRLLWGNAAPTTGNWTRGDIVFHQFPASGGFIGWVYTNAGWKTFGVIS